MSEVLLLGRGTAGRGSGWWETCIRRCSPISTLSSEETINAVTDWTSGHSVPCKSSLNVKSCHSAPMPQHWYYVVTVRSLDTRWISAPVWNCAVVSWGAACALRQLPAWRKNPFHFLSLSAQPMQPSSSSAATVGPAHWPLDRVPTFSFTSIPIHNIQGRCLSLPTLIISLYDGGNQVVVENPNMIVSQWVL